ncbi:MAG TPA: RNA-binding domain-containing protein [Anaerovoracaceae bacterium]|nr:RNA-binding domain-containing protein [Anaerovoracaceae bacterium]
MAFESEKLEYKSTAVEDIDKTVVAFANTTGGRIIVGTSDDGEAIGLADIDEDYTRITNIVRDKIEPDVTMFVKYTLNNNKTINIDVSEGSSKPYYIKAKGLKPSGVYIRQGASSVPASAEQIRQMIKLSDGDIFEDGRALNQQLTFDAAKGAFESKGIPLEKSKYATLGVCSIDDRLFTNLGLILSDQCEHTIKVAVFSDEANTIFKAHKEFGGSVFNQLEETFDYLMLCNQNKSEIKGLERTDKWDYPQEAIREALLNSIIHRDYGFSGSIIVNVNDTKIEFISIGGLLPGLTTEDIKSGISQPRNRKLADIFHRLRYIESYGTGIRRIYTIYKNCPQQPTIIVTPNTFKIILPNQNNPSPTSDQGTKKLEATPQEQKVIKYLYDNNEMTDEEIQELLHIKKTRTFTLVKDLESKGYVVIEGRGKDKKYRLK